MNEQEYSNKSTLICAIAAMTLGFVGGHKFYTGRVKDGFIHILSSFFLIGLLLALYDFVMIISGKFRDKEGKLLQSLGLRAKGTYEERVKANMEYIEKSPYGTFMRWLAKQQEKLESKKQELDSQGNNQEDLPNNKNEEKQK